MNPSGGMIKRRQNKFVFISAVCLLFLALLSLPVKGQGSFSVVKFYSSSLQKERNVQVYLPEGYSQNGATRYPVIYFLHGATMNHTSYGEMLGILNTLINEDKIVPVIVVKPDGSASPWGGSFYTNSELYGNFEDYIVNDLTEFIDNNFKTIASKDMRSIMGHSMGAYGAMKLALKHPDIYCAVASYSGPLDFSHWTDRIAGTLAENGGVPVAQYSPFAGPYTFLFYTLAGAFSPNLANSPYQVDFPLDNMGNFKDQVYQRWVLHDPVKLATDMIKPTSLSIYFDCGIQDELLLYPFNNDFDNKLTTLGLQHEYQTFTGGHANQIAARLPIGIQFLINAMDTEGMRIDDDLASLTSDYLLKQNYPNPFSTHTTISFILKNQEDVHLNFCDLQGRVISVLLDETKQPGEHTVDFNTEQLPEGIYMYRLITDNHVESQMCVLMK